MGAETKIAWCDATVNFWWGCTKVSAACDHCYAEKWSDGRLQKGLWGHGKPRLKIKGAAALAFKLERRAVREGRRLKVFSNSMSDFFDSEVPDEWRDEAMAVIALTPHLDWLVLTKRPKVMREYFAEQWQGVPEQDFKFGDTIVHQRAGGPTGRRSEVYEACEPLLDRFGLNDPSKDELWTEAGSCKAMQWQWPLPNLWLGVTAEDQGMYDLRVPLLRETPAARRFVSCEPLLAAVDAHLDEAGLDWVICGGESGEGARPMHPDWARSLRDQCEAAGVPFFFKQWGEWLPGENYLRKRPAEPAAWQDGETGQHSSCRGRPESKMPEWQHYDGEPGTPGAFGLRLGTKRAGNLLDGRTWEQFPAEQESEVAA